jgi:hypothetical protein
LNGLSCWGVELANGELTHVHADRVWVDGGCLFFCEERENPDAGKPGEADTANYTTVIFAANRWVRTFAASIVDGSPLPLVRYDHCTLSQRQGFAREREA